MNLRKTALQYLKNARLSGITSFPAASPLPESHDAVISPWDELKQTVKTCTRCSISRNIHNYVFGEGNTNADLMFIGEGPGEQEDLKGIPFIGRAGELLTDIITKGMKLRREDIYIANIVKCRPPGNRNPLPDEIGNCFGYLEKQIELVSPKVIVTLGKVPSHVILKTEMAITRLRGEFKMYRNIPVMPTFHPAYLLRNPEKKREVWEDIKQVMMLLGLPISS